MPHRLDGIQAKLERANENILNLEREIAAFLQDGPHAIISDDESGAFQKALKAHTNRTIPQRFGILSGEIIHHLRACLDNITWELSSAEKRTTDPSGIEFPIYISKPTDKSEIHRYERKVEGISSRGRNIIEQLQPYHRDPKFLLTGPNCDPLWIIHDMDTTDKHRELILTTATFRVPAEGMPSIWLMLYREHDFPEEDIAGLGRAFYPNSEITTQISFRKFGGRKAQPVIPALYKLTHYVQRVLLVFMDECF